MSMRQSAGKCHVVRACSVGQTRGSSSGDTPISRLAGRAAPASAPPAGAPQCRLSTGAPSANACTPGLGPGLLQGLAAGLPGGVRASLAAASSPALSGDAWHGCARNGAPCAYGRPASPASSGPGDAGAAPLGAQLQDVEASVRFSHQAHVAKLACSLDNVCCGTSRTAKQVLLAEANDDCTTR